MTDASSPLAATSTFNIRIRAPAKRISQFLGIACAFFIAIIGTNILLLAGYHGGRVDAALMRITGLAFGIPFIPFAVVLVALLGPSLWNMILTISLLMWRTTARVIRSQVLS